MPIPAAFKYRLTVSRRIPVSASMRRSDQPRLPSPKICCLFVLFKTLLINAGDTIGPAFVNVLKHQPSLAGFEVIFYGCF